MSRTSKDYQQNTYGLSAVHLWTFNRTPLDYQKNTTVYQNTPGFFFYLDFTEIKLDAMSCIQNLTQYFILIPYQYAVKLLRLMFSKLILMRVLIYDTFM